MTKEERSRKFSKYGGAILAVVNLCFKNNRNSNTSKANFSTNKPRSYKSITEDFIAGNTSTTSTPEKAISCMFKPRMRRSESSWRSSQGKLLWRRPSCRSKLREQNSTSWLQIFITWLRPKPFLECTILLIHN